MMRTNRAPQFDLDQAIEISDGSYWIGVREGVLLECNVFLRVFRQRSQPAVNLIIDPGPPAHLNALSEKVSSVIGGLSKLNLAFVNHQDPDVAMNAAHIQKLNPRLSVLCSEDTWRLIRFYGLDQQRFVPTERYKNQDVILSTGHRLRFVPSPYCHFRGATMLYDLETRILYTGDLFGGLSLAQGLWADETSWRGIKAFHQIYMPHKDALRYAVDAIRKLKPKPLIIAPQHGALIQGKWIDEFLDRMDDLPVGIELFELGYQKQHYIEAMNEILVELRQMLGDELIGETLRGFIGDGTNSPALVCDEFKVCELNIAPNWALGLFLQQIEASLPEHASIIEVVAIKICMDRGIPITEDTIALSHQEALTPPPPELKLSDFGNIMPPSGGGGGGATAENLFSKHRRITEQISRPPGGREIAERGGSIPAIIKSRASPNNSNIFINDLNY